MEWNKLLYSRRRTLRNRIKCVMTSRQDLTKLFPTCEKELKV